MRVLGLFNMFRSKQQVKEVLVARELAQRISARADHINGQLEAYCLHEDPFAAMMRDLYGKG